MSLAWHALRCLLGLRVQNRTRGPALRFITFSLRERSQFGQQRPLMYFPAKAAPSHDQLARFRRSRLGLFIRGPENTIRRWFYCRQMLVRRASRRSFL